MSVYQIIALSVGVVVAGPIMAYIYSYFVSAGWHNASINIVARAMKEKKESQDG